MKRTTRLCFLLAVAATSLSAAPSLADVRFEQRLGERIPLDGVFVDTAGASHRLREFFDGKPVVLYFGYARCPQLCSVVADGTVAALRQIRPAVARDFNVVSISLDPSESIAEARLRERDAVRRYGEAGDPRGWHFLTGREPEIRAVAAACGFRYVYDSVSRQYAHPSGFVVLTPDGIVSKYFLGIEFTPNEVAQAITSAGRGETGRPAFDLLLRCFRGDAIAGRYGALIWRTLGVSVALTVLLLGGGVAWMLASERRALALKKP